jgi:hypothetical protein
LGEIIMHVIDDLPPAHQINWKGGIGYGDIISPMGYAFNYAMRHSCPVDLTFHYEHSADHKHKPEDTETIGDWTNFIYENMDSSDLSHPVVVRNRYNYEWDFEPETDRFPHTGYDDTPLSYHNLRFSRKYEWAENPNSLVIVPSFRNKYLHEGGKKFKDPNPNIWYEAVNYYSKIFPEVHIVDYNTPIQEAVNTICNSAGVLSYHGSAAWLARWLQAPLVMISDKPSWTGNLFPWALVQTAATFQLSNSIIDDFAESIDRIEIIKAQREAYLDLHRL